MGVDPERLRLEWVSASEAQLFAEAVESFTETIKKLGPMPQGVEDPAVAEEEVHA